MRSFEKYWEDVVPRIIEMSEDLTDRKLDETQKALHGLIMQVFSFSANCVTKLDKKTEVLTVPLFKDIEDHLRQLGKLGDPYL